MKILTVVFSLGNGGTERAAQNFAIGYKHLGCDSRVLYVTECGPRERLLFNEGILVYSYYRHNELLELQEWRPSVVHVHSHGISEEVFLDLTTYFMGSDIVETNVFSNPSPWVEKLYASFQLSSWCYWRYKRQSRNASELISVVPNPIVTSSFMQAAEERRKNRRALRLEYGIPHNAFVIGRVGQPNIASWSSLLVDIFESVCLKEPAVWLLLANPPSIIEDRLARSTCRKSVTIIKDSLDDGALRKVYSSMDLFLHIAGIGESFGYVNAEAVLTGTPVLTMATPWFGNSQIEVVENGVSGFVFHRRETAEHLIHDFINGRLSLSPAIGIKSIYERYDYLRVCQKLLEAIAPHSLDKAEPPAHPVHLMVKSYDKPSDLVLLLLRLGLPGLTLFASGYESWARLPLRLLHKGAARLRNLWAKGV